MPVALTTIERRVLGCLLEKERTVPDTYPMTLNGLVTACNQSSGRDPIMSLAEHEVVRALDSLRQQNLTRRVLPSHGARTEKYRQVADEVWQLDDAERAIVTLLLLRGPQTPGELRSRSGRLHQFDDLAAVESALRALAGRDDPLVEQLAREQGRKEPRWQHRFAPADELAATAAAAVRAAAAPTPGGGGATGSGVTAAAPAGVGDAPSVELHPAAAALAPWSGRGAATATARIRRSHRSTTTRPSRSTPCPASRCWRIAR